MSLSANISSNYITQLVYSNLNFQRDANNIPHIDPSAQWPIELVLKKIGYGSQWPIELVLKKIGYGIILGLISLFAVVGNLFVIFAMKNEKHLRTVRIFNIFKNFKFR